eukprot:gnl/TRDRNA2_/TRDRNA2_171829_c0_seq2.p1 gnl/TRDRNA2_/TRDRNA2_171829_c0~~gnl/TRDRNA2_/TRDRNA2_171829_c0_seq2.p1  ORF type:complete len:133 (+),score=12.54 gnl/TRDRNA2_/TRDRNA2_171829_c0_seq2:167-565(+)
MQRFATMWANLSNTLRLSYDGIGDQLGARMPVIYMHLVQILVDTLTVLTPFTLFAQLGVTSVLLNGLLVAFFQGLLFVSKRLLDPYNSTDFDLIEVPALVKDFNEASTRYVLEGRFQDVSRDKFNSLMKVSR